MAFLAMVFVVPSAGQPGATWRFWDSADGFVESYTTSAAVSHGGEVWVKHGSSGPVERLDGYFAPHFRDPEKLGELAVSPGGAVWMWGGSEIKRLLNGSWAGWKVGQVSAFGEQHNNFHLSWDIVSRASPSLQGTISVVGVDETHALILLPDQVLQFDASRAAAETVLPASRTGLSRFVAMTAGLNGTVIVSGAGGWGRLTHNGADRWSWKPLAQPPAPFVEFDFPLEVSGASSSGGESLFLTGVAKDQATEALSYDGRNWKSLYRGEARTVRALPGADGAVWIQDGNNLLELAGKNRRPAEKEGVLSGVILNVAAERAGKIWIATSQGLGRVSPSLWRAPLDSPPLDDVVNSILEDRSGNLWFLAAHALIRYDNSNWKSWPLPKGETSWAIFAEGLQALPDGRLVVRVTASHLLVFDPATGRYKTTPYPESKVIRMIAPGPEGQVLAEAIDPETKKTSLELFDGDRFRPFADSQKLGGSIELRAIEFLPGSGISGDAMYVGGTNSFGIWRNGAYQTIGANDGFSDPGAFSVRRIPDGRVFAGGRDGLFELQNSKWRRLMSGLDRVRKIVAGRDGTLWLATGTGIQRCRGGICLSNTEDDGLPSGVAYSVFEDSRGRIWAGTTRGLSLFHGDADPDPPIAELDSERNPREAPPGGKVVLTFSGVDKWKFTLPSRLLFSWRMDGGAWSPFVSRNSASFTGLSPGPHKFEVRAMDRNGNISLTPATHDFTMLVQWYETAGFRFLAGTGALLIVGSFAIALMSYVHRGRLIEILNQRNKLELDRQKILQMTANREPLARTLYAIARSVAENCPGGTCMLIAEGNSGREVHCVPPVPEQVLAELRSFDASPCNAAEWRERIRPISDRFFAQDFLVVPISSADRSDSIIALLFAGPVSTADSIELVVQTFANLAAGAIENSRLYGQLAYQARHDVLTGLPNRACFEEDLRSLVGSCSLEDEFAVLYLDLDRFKKINDTLGHRVGDLFLQQVSLRLSGALKGADRLFRIGGDEFIVLSRSEGGKEAAMDLAAGLLSALKAPIAIGGNELFASASIGISFYPEDGDSTSVLQKNADIAMYRAKAKGRNGFELFARDMTPETGAVHGLEQILRRAAAEGRFRLYYQPQFTPSGRPAGFEAVLRLVHPERGPIEAREFIPLARESGLIVPIGQWVLREVCRQLTDWRSEGLQDTRICIRVSPEEISRASYAAGVEAVLKEMQIPGRLIQIEVTASSSWDNPGECARQMKRLLALGVKLTLGEFGTGSSALSCLQAFPVDMVTIGFKPPLLHGVVAMVRCMGLGVTVDGIETREHLSAASAVLSEGLDLVRGNYLSAPVSGAEAIGLISGFAYLRMPSLAAETQSDSSLSIASEHCAVLTP